MSTNGQLNLCMFVQRRKEGGDSSVFDFFVGEWFMVWEGGARVRPLFSVDNGKVNALPLLPRFVQLLKGYYFNREHSTTSVTFQMNFQSNLQPFQTL